jgi:hypothetical protein
MDGWAAKRILENHPDTPHSDGIQSDEHLEEAPGWEWPVIS